MEISAIALIGGIWLSLLYSATVVPATVRVIQLTVTRGWLGGFSTGFGVVMGQAPWILLASSLLFEFTGFWRSADMVLRFAASLFLLWMAYRTARAPEVTTIHSVAGEHTFRLVWLAFRRSLVMPWRLPVWASLILSTGAHLRGPGWEAAPVFCLGAIAGQLLWHAHFVIVAALFGHRVPEVISLRSMNKFRMLGAIVLGGLALIILAPLAFPPI